MKESERERALPSPAQPSCTAPHWTALHRTVSPCVCQHYFQRIRQPSQLQLLMMIVVVLLLPERRRRGDGRGERRDGSTTISFVSNQILPSLFIPLSFCVPPFFGTLSRGKTGKKYSQLVVRWEGGGSDGEREKGLHIHGSAFGSCLNPAHGFSYCCSE